MGGKHLTLDDRILIANYLLRGYSVRQIADLLHVSHTTVSRELVARRQFQPGGDGAPCPSACLRQGRCPFARRGRKCSGSCPDFTPSMPCARLNRAPFVCDGCGEFPKCSLGKMLYHPAEADKSYRARLSESREGADLNWDERARLDALLRHGLSLGQSPVHLVAANPDTIGVCARTIYRYIASGILPYVRRLELQRASKMKPRKGRRKQRKADPHCRDGRAYEDFLAFLEEHPGTRVVQMDTVLGTRGGRCLLTLHLGGACPLQLAFIRQANDALSVIEAFDALERALGTELFRQLLPVVLTDNGSEFTDPEKLERSALREGRRRTRVFYCEPYSSWQKPMVEGSNEYLRQVFPKGVAIPDVAQEQVSLALSHVNAKIREALNMRSAADVFIEMWGEKVFGKLGLVKIDPREVNLTPGVLSSGDGRK